MRFFQPVVMLLGVATWILFFLYWGEAQGNGNYLLPFSIIGVWNLLVLIAAVVTIVDCVLKVRAKASRPDPPWCVRCCGSSNSAKRTLP